MKFRNNHKKPICEKHLNKVPPLASIFFFSGLLFLLPANAQAAIVDCSGLGCTWNDLLDIPVKIYNWLLGMAGLVFLGVIIWGGIKMMIYYLSEMPEAELKNAKYTITRGIMGLLIIAFSFLIVHILVVTIFDIELAGNWLTDLLARYGIIE